MTIKKNIELLVPVKIKIKPPKRNIVKQSYPIFKGIFFGLVFAGLFSAVIFTFATYGSDEPYPLGNTLSPDCVPGATYCTVITPAAYSFAANNFSGTGNFTTTGTLIAPTLVGGSATTSDLNLKTTSGVGPVKPTGTSPDSRL
ncbi:MAG: hypothetical protein US35_C0016G0014 [Parcubacteria group bacterium GW2011_GWA2_37_10]|nr:MAG: hypothetical protein US35_C0016G0014 [Parcubacteria group bacterium GW2011_GWA2_37_10]